MSTQPRKIAVLDLGYKDYQSERKLLEHHGYELHLYPGDPSDARAKADFASDAVSIFVRWTRVDHNFLSACPQLRVIIRYGAGYENIDLEAASIAGVRVANVGGYGNHSVSDHALSLIYAGTRGLFPGTAGLFDNFGKAPFPRMFELHRKTLGIIGLGRIGGTLAGKATGLFGRVLAADPHISDARFVDLGVEKCSLKELLQQSHVISIHCNLTEKTRQLIDRLAFEEMKQKPMLVNTARGPVIDAVALLEALDNDQIMGIGLDVFDSEIPGDIPQEILEHPRSICTGHYAWYSENSLGELQKRAAQNMLALLQNQSIEDALN